MKKYIRNLLILNFTFFISVASWASDLSDDEVKANNSSVIVYGISKKDNTMKFLLAHDRQRDFWTPPGGKIEKQKGQNAREAGVAELFEETAAFPEFHPSKTSKLIDLTQNKISYNGHTMIYAIPVQDDIDTYDISNGWQKRIQDKNSCFDEMDKWAWISLKELKEELKGNNKYFMNGIRAYVLNSLINFDNKIGFENLSLNLDKKEKNELSKIENIEKRDFKKMDKNIFYPEIYIGLYPGIIQEALEAKMDLVEYAIYHFNTYKNPYNFDPEIYIGLYPGLIKNAKKLEMDPVNYAMHHFSIFKNPYNFDPEIYIGLHPALKIEAENENLNYKKLDLVGYAIQHFAQHKAPYIFNSEIYLKKFPGVLEEAIEKGIDPISYAKTHFSHFKSCDYSLFLYQPEKETSDIKKYKDLVDTYSGQNLAVAEIYTLDPKKMSIEEAMALEVNMLDYGIINKSDVTKENYKTLKLFIANWKEKNL